MGFLRADGWTMPWSDRHGPAGASMTTPVTSFCPKDTQAAPYWQFLFICSKHWLTYLLIIISRGALLRLAPEAASFSFFLPFLVFPPALFHPLHLDGVRHGNMFQRGVSLLKAGGEGTGGDDGQFGMWGMMGTFKVSTYES